MIEMVNCLKKKCKYNIDAKYVIWPMHVAVPNLHHLQQCTNRVIITKDCM